MANVVPRLCSELQRACRAGDFPRAMALQARLAPLISALERETNPGPAKFALSLLRPHVTPDLRLPLVAPRSETARAVADALEALLAGGQGDPCLEGESVSCAT